MDPYCPNKPTCKIVQGDCSVTTNSQRDSFIENFCNSADQKWEECKRFQIKAVLGFCPDFVLPDNCMTVDEVIEEFDTI